MANILPFSAIRPKEGLEEQIAALPYDVYSRKEAKAEVERAPLSFLRIDRAETQFPDTVGMYEESVYQKAHTLLWEMVQQGELVQEATDCFYVYELIMNGRSQTGIVACASVDDYINETIKKHEKTREDKEIDRIRHVDVCDAQTGPIFLAYRGNLQISEIVQETKKENPIYDFEATDGVIHRIWRINKENTNYRIVKLFEEVNSIYIADGHHRCASAVKVSLKRRANNKNHNGTESYNYFLSVLFPDDQLMIMDYNRVVTDLNGMSEKIFLEKIKESFIVEKKDNKAYKPEAKGCFGMYLSSGWYKLTVKESSDQFHPVSSLDVSLLQDKLLFPVLGIEDPKIDKRIDFVGGIRGLIELEKRVHTDAAVAFAMYPTAIDELFAVSDAGLLMPPKSTWFEPKLRSGLFIHSIVQD